MIGFEYNGSHSYDDFSIVANSVNRPILPAMRKRELVIPGKHGSYDFGGNTYENRIISVLLQYIGTSINALRLQMRDVAAWLSQTDYKELIFDDEPDKFHFAKVYSALDIETFYRSGKGTVQFECQPFAQYVVTTAEDIYLDDGAPLDLDVILDSGDDFKFALATEDSSDEVTIVNNGNADLGLGAQEGAQFDIVVTGTFSAFSITMNGKTLTYTENCTGQTITIDNVNATVKNGSTNKLDKLTGDTADFLKLLPGNNTVTIAKTGGAVDFTFDFSPQYL
jgi:predicted phage tail component-like protein